MRSSVPPRGFYRSVLLLLREAGVPYLVGGAYALERYTEITRDTKDLDLFVRPDDCQRALDVLAAAGYRTELTSPHWLGKVMMGEEMVDLIFSSGNGIARVDDLWFEHGVEAELLGVTVQLCPPEEMIWSKAFVMERERFDGADVAHLLRACGAALDWPRLLWRFGPHWRVLFAHLILFGFIYPGEGKQVPAALVRDLARRIEVEATSSAPDERLCRGTLLSRAQYLIDVEKWGSADARLAEPAPMTAEDVRSWTQAIDRDLPEPAASPDPAAPGKSRGGHGAGTAGGAG
jgi:hypothetical protein